MSKSLFDIPFVDRKFHVWYHPLFVESFDCHSIGISSSTTSSVQYPVRYSSWLQYSNTFPFTSIGTLTKCKVDFRKDYKIIEIRKNCKKYLCILFIYVRNVVIKMSSLWIKMPNFFFFTSSVSLFRRFKSICFAGLVTFVSNNFRIWRSYPRLGTFESIAEQEYRRTA